MPGIEWRCSLLAQHAVASHLPKRLDWLVTEYCDAAPWKIVHGRRGDTGQAAEKGAAIEDMAASELAQYNASDCKLTALCWARMQGNLKPELEVYKHDLALSEVCMRMASVGIHVDLSRKHLLARMMRNRAVGLREEMATLLGGASFSPSKLGDVRNALFGKLRTRVVAVTASGLASTSNATLETLRGTDTKVARFATLLLNWRGVMKARSTYVGGEEGKPLKFDQIIGKDGRARYGWKPFGTVSGRLSCRLQSVPRYDPKDIACRAREIYTASTGNRLVYFDVSQAEMRLAAYLSGDATFMAACGADVHAGNAKVVFPEIAAKGWLDGDAKKDPACGKPYRDIAKNLGFAICYGAEAERVFMTLLSQGFKVTFRAVELILSKLRAAYKVYYRWVEKNVERVRQCGYMRSPIIGRIRWFGWFPKPTEIANFPVQSALADIMNIRTIELDARLKAERIPAHLNMQIHDSCYVDTPEKHVLRVSNMIKDIWVPPVELPGTGRSLVLPIDSKTAFRMSEL